ncbi:MAG TPA: D-alanine:D-lactate ligase-like protein [Rhizobiaceae bacterium]|nr:D-alanine:D-lactate ligase-like protein [Rhizobiaceae bacterium]
MAGKFELILVYEAEADCRQRLLAEGFTPDHALEITSYLAQSTDIAPEFGAIAEACRSRGVGFRPVRLDDAPGFFGECDPAASLVWTLTDGIAYFRGGVAPALARFHGLKTIGADDSLFALCQDKFRAGSVLRALGMPVPAAGLARNGEWIAPPPGAASGYFVKPNRLGSKIGIWPESRCMRPEEALDLSRRIHAAYRDDAIVQAYVPGRNARASFLAVQPDADMEKLGIFFVDSGVDFQTMADSLALYGDTGLAASAAGRQSVPNLLAVCDNQAAADRTMRAIAAGLIRGLGLRDVFSIDFRVEPDDTVHMIEFEVCPGLPCFDFRAYCRSCWGMNLADAMAETAAGRLLPRAE